MLLFSWVPGIYLQLFYSLNKIEQYPNNTGLKLVILYMEMCILTFSVILRSTLQYPH